MFKPHSVQKRPAQEEESACQGWSKMHSGSASCGKQGEDVFCPKLVYTYNAVTYDGTPAQGGYSTHVVVDEA
jgi:D-arabinose 1-dehydrogenase-like Zn-dependent alcohol dehydrogenase